MDSAASPNQLRSFGLIVGGVFSLLGVWPALVHGRPLRAWALGLGGLLIVPALVYPALLRGPHRVWMAAGGLLGWINSRIILSIFFYVILTPVGVFLRLLGKDPMRRRYDPKAGSYRQTREPRPASHMWHQF
jgi:Saxitoxin biosynthesis operon protein SxtJ